MTDRTTVLDRLERQRARTVAWIEDFDADAFATPCTPSEDPDGEPWSPKDHVVHLLRIETAFAGMAEATVAGRSDPIGIPGDTFEDKLASVHRENEAHVRALADLDRDGLLRALTDARDATVALVGRLSDDDLDRPIPGAPWGDGTIAGVLSANALHEKQHLAWVDEATAG